MSFLGAYSGVVTTFWMSIPSTLYKNNIIQFPVVKELPYNLKNACLDLVYNSLRAC